MTTNRKRPRAAAARTTPATASATPSSTRGPTKTERLLAMLQSPDGTSIEEVSEALGWQHHSTRAALTGLRKKDHTIIRDKQGSVTTYRITG